MRRFGRQAGRQVGRQGRFPTSKLGKSLLSVATCPKALMLVKEETAETG